MSWSVSIIGTAGTLADVAADKFRKASTGGSPQSPEAVVKDKLGEIAMLLAATIADPRTVLKVTATGSAWNSSASEHFSLSQTVKFEFETLHAFLV